MRSRRRSTASPPGGAKPLLRLDHMTAALSNAFDLRSSRRSPVRGFLSEEQQAWVRDGRRSSALSRSAALTAAAAQAAANEAAANWAQARSWRPMGTLTR